MKKKWTKKENHKLRILSKSNNFREISTTLKRTHNSIRAQAIKLGIKSIYKPNEETKKQEIRNKIANTLKILGLRPPSPLGRKASEETKRKMRLSHKGEKSHNWKGEKVGYHSLHTWVRRWLGKPNTCEHCGEKGLSGKYIHWANKSRNYKRDLSDWIRLCNSCHAKYDRRWLSRIRNQRGQFL